MNTTPPRNENTSMPPDRSDVLTEQRNPRTMQLHAMSVADIVRCIGREDRAVLDAMDAASESLAKLIEAIEPHFIAGGRVIYVGAGTSGRLAVLDASEAPPTFQVSADRMVGIIAGGDAALRVSSEGREDEWDGAVRELDALPLREHDAVIGIAAGGTTPYVLGALDHAAKRHPAGVRALVTCSPVPPRESIGHVIVLPTGPEVITGSTRMKAGTATKLALNTISSTLMIRSGRVFENLMVDLKASNTKLRDRAARIVMELTGLGRAAAFDLLDRAGGQVKVAIVMHRKSMNASDAQRLLEQHGDRLDAALGE